jgi:hypothetical protein
LWKEWSDGWIREGYHISYEREGVTYYERVVMRDWARYVYFWPEAISAGEESKDKVTYDLEITRGYDDRTKTNHVWQLIFGIKGEPYVYVQHPTDIKRHGVAKISWPTTGLREVAHYEEWMSPFNEPSFVTEHFLMRPDALYMALTAYNPMSIDIPEGELEFNFIIAKLMTDRIGTESAAGLEPAKPKWKDILEKLSKGLVTCRPITILPIRYPAEAPKGE